MLFGRPTLDDLLASLSVVVDKLDEHGAQQHREVSEHLLTIAQLQSQVAEKQQVRDRAYRISKRLSELLA